MYVCVCMYDTEVSRSVSGYLLQMLSLCAFQCVYPHIYDSHTRLCRRLFLSADVCVCWPVAVWCRPIKMEEIDDQGLRVVEAAAETAAGSCFLQTTGNEMALFSWRCQRQHRRASKTNHHHISAAGLLLHLFTGSAPLSNSLSLSLILPKFLCHQSVVNVYSCETRPCHLGSLY